MLIPAKLVEEQLLQAWRQACLHDVDRMRWYRMAVAATWVPAPHADGDWGAIARASVRMVDGAPVVLGYCRASIDRETQVATQLSAWSAQPGSMTYLRDLHRFCDQVLGQVRLARFTCALDNPARRGWERWVARKGGRQLCVLEAVGRSVTGQLINAAHYQVPGLLRDTQDPAHVFNQEQPAKSET